MPMMMEDYDDLFNESINLPPPPPPAKGLPERLDELRRNGASQRVAWSKMGCIAYISSDSKEVRLAYLQYARKTGSWNLRSYMDPNFPDAISKIYKGRRIQTLSWNLGGMELLVVDTHGRLSIHTTIISINRMPPAKAFQSDVDSCLGAIVGSTWLNPKKNILTCHSALKQGGQWNSLVQQQELKGPSNPLGIKMFLSAFLVVTRGGYVRLAYQGSDAVWQDVKYEIDDLSTSDDLITHAAFCPDKDSLLLAVHTAGKQLRLYRITIDWPQSSTKELNPSSPRINCLHLETVAEFNPQLEERETQSDIFMVPSMEAQLSHLELLPPVLDQRETLSPMLLAVFSHLPNQYGGNSMGEQPYSVLSRWELRTRSSNLHTGFSSLTSRKPGPTTPPKEATTLTRLEDLRIEGIVIRLQIVSDNMRVAVGYSDGRWDFRDRRKLIKLPSENHPDRAFHLVEEGFGFRNIEPCLDMALSPNKCVKAYLSPDYELKISTIKPDSSDVESQNYFNLEKAGAAFVVQHTASAYVLHTMDDLLLTLHELKDQLPPEQFMQLGNNLLKDLYRALNVRVEYPTDTNNELFLRNQYLQRVLSVQASIGEKSLDGTRSLPSQVAWVIMNLRMIAMSIALSYQKQAGSTEQGADLAKPEILHSMIALITWSLNLTDYIMDELFELNRNIDPTTGFDTNLLTGQAPLPLLLLLTSTSRTLLKYNCRGLRGLLNCARSPAPNAALAPIHTALLHCFARARITPGRVELFLAEVDSLVKHAYEAKGIGASATPAAPAPAGKQAGAQGGATSLADAKRADLERGMMVTGIIPVELRGVAERLATACVEEMREKGVKEGELYFSDFKGLGLEDNAGEDRGKVLSTIPVAGVKDEKKGVVVGVRIAADGKMKMRACARCGAQMEDVVPVRGHCEWMSHLQRTCFCGGFWVLMP